MLETREQLRYALDIAYTHAPEPLQRSRAGVWYGHKARLQEFKQGGAVVMRLPNHTAPLQLKFMVHILLRSA